LLAVINYEEIMRLSISTNESKEEKGTWIAVVDWFKYDGGEVGTPGAVKYGDTKEEATNKLKKLLEEKGHTVID
jgi:hypothetical protein